MSDLFSIVGEDFFKPLTSYYKKIYLQCLEIIYDSYRTELSYGIDREHLAQKLEYYFDDLGNADIQFEGDSEVLSDSRAKASTFLRKLREFGWIETEIGSDQRTKVIMPPHAVSVIRNFEVISAGKETEYQSEISAIYSLLINPDLLSDPYPQIIRPVYDRTQDLFTGLKQLSSSIKKYIDAMTADKEAKEIIDNFFAYQEEIGSRAFHRLHTSENVSRFRTVILSKLNDLFLDAELFEKIAWGYQKVEEEPDLDAAKDRTRKMINDITDYFHSYDDIIADIERKHTKYLDSTVRRARFLLMNTNNTEGKISSILRYLSEQFNNDEENHLEEDASDDICRIFNIFSQGFVSNESIKTIPLSKRITEVEDIFIPEKLTEEERRALRIAAYEKNKNRFSKKNITDYVTQLLKEKETVMASTIPITGRRDMIRVIFISLYGQATKSDYIVVPTEKWMEAQGFRYHDFEIRRKKHD